MPSPYDEIDFNDKSPENQQHILDTLAFFRRQRNLITLDEFNKKYIYLFRKDLLLERDPQEVRLIAKSYFTAIDPYHPVYVVKAKNRPLDQNNVVYVLPPIFNQVNTVNGLVDTEETGVEILQSFTNIAAFNIVDTFGAKSNYYGKKVEAVIEATNPSYEMDEKRQRAREEAQGLPNIAPEQGEPGVYEDPASYQTETTETSDTPHIDYSSLNTEDIPL